MGRASAVVFGHRRASHLIMLQGMGQRRTGRCLAGGCVMGKREALPPLRRECRGMWPRCDAFDARRTEPAPLAAEHGGAEAVPVQPQGTGSAL